MTKKLDNNKIETLEGEENMSTQETYTQKKSLKRFIKPLAIGAVVVALAGGGAAYAHGQYEQSQRAKINEAYSKVKINVVAPTNNSQTSSDQNSTDNNSTDSNNQNTTNTTQTPQQAKTQDEIKQIVADTIGVDQNSITFDRIKPDFGGDDDFRHDWKKGKFNQNNNNNNNQVRYTYEVEARANNLEYDLEIDALTGQVLDVDID